MNTTYRMRPATLNDWSSIVALDQQIFGAYGAQEDPTIIRSRLQTFPRGCAALEGYCSEGRLNGATMPESRKIAPSNPFITGYLTTEKWAELREPALDEEPRETHRPDGRVLNITTLAVAPSRQNQGLGTRLLDYAITVARQEACTQIILETAKAEQFYARHRFRRVGERIQRGITLAVLVLDLTERAC